jgi:hypothetical protein
MSDYITRLNHFRFGRNDDTLIVTSERDDSFEKRFDLDGDEELTDEYLFETYYTDVLSEYESRKS